MGDSTDVESGMKADKADAQLTRLYQGHYDEILAYCARRIGRTDADRAAADVFAIAWRHLDEIEWETVRPWLYRIARGVLSNRWRSARRRKRLLSRVTSLAPAVQALPEDQVVRRAEDEAVLASLQRLKATDREILMLAAWEELTGPELARTLHISVSAAEQRLHRAKKRFAAILSPNRSRAKSTPRAADQRGGAR